MAAVPPAAAVAGMTFLGGSSAYSLSVNPLQSTSFLSVAFVDNSSTELLRTPELTDPAVPGDVPPDANIWDFVSQQRQLLLLTRSATISDGNQPTSGTLPPPEENSS